MRILSQIHTFAVGILWAVLLILLPITSMPAVRDLLHINTIAGPSVLALAVLLVLQLLPYLIRNGGIPRASLPLLGFILAALLSIAAAQFIQVPTFKDAGTIRSSLSAFITLLVGVAYFLVTYSLVSTEKEFRHALKWIYLGGLLMLVWSLMQSGTWFVNGRYPGWMRDFQDLISMGPLYRQRAAGFALEPSWLAHMLNMLYLPMWLAAAIGRYSAFSLRLFQKITVEMVLLALGVLVLILTLSRVGWISFFCMAAFLVIQWNIRLVKWIQYHFKAGRDHKTTATLLITLGLISIYLAVIVLAAFGMSKVDPRMADLFTQEFWQLNNFNRYANALQFGERVVYWQAGWEIFNRYPVLGVGLGNAGKWFAETIPSYGMNLIEVRQLLYRSPDLPNIKNLWIRLFAETGLVGFAFFSSWLLSFLRSTVRIELNSEKTGAFARYWGIFVVIGIILEGFSIDSFAMPFFWISVGMVLSVNKITGGRIEGINE